MTFYEKYKKIVLTPNFLTLLRIFAVPIIIIFLLFDNRITTFFAALFFSIASITDFFDGYFARKYGLVSNLGKMLDPLADKLLISSIFIMLVSLDFMPAWVACIIIGREIAVTGLRCILVEHGEDVASSMLGKYKTGFQIAAAIPLTLHYKYFGVDFKTIGMVMLYGALVFTVWSGIDYFIKSKKLLGL